MLYISSCVLLYVDRYDSHVIYSIKVVLRTPQQCGETLGIIVFCVFFFCYAVGLKVEARAGAQIKSLGAVFCAVQQQ